MSGRRAALYLRLSKDDEGTAESASITAQRRILRAWAEEHGLDVAAEYVDDGYSGTSFDRPAFQRMLRDIELGKLDAVLVKDLSRLGRDYIQTGQYTEVYFPARNVRCVAVGDNYDSEGPSTDLAPFQNVVNELYARDTSRKIRAALRARMESGEFVGSFAPYGYCRDSADRHRLIPDPGAADTVRHIFTLAAQGARPAQIAQALNARGISPPGVYRLRTHPALSMPQVTGGGLWTAQGVAKLLRNPVYLGQLTQGRTGKASFRSGPTRRLPAERWLVSAHAHTPLVDEATFSLARRQLACRALPREQGFCNLFSGLAFCADCGHAMSSVGTRRQGGRADLVCGAYKAGGRARCSSHAIPYEDLSALVCSALHRALALPPAEQLGLEQELLRTLRRWQGNGADELLAQLDRRCRALDRIFEQLCEDRAAGLLADQRFAKLSARYEGEQRDLLEQIAALRRQTSQSTPVLPRLPAVPDAAFFRAFLARIDVGPCTWVPHPDGRQRRQQIRITFRFSYPAETLELAR